MKALSNIAKLMACLITIGVLFAACQPSQEKLTEQIVQLEKESLEQYDTIKMNDLLSLYQSYIEQFPQDSLAANYLFSSGKINMALRKGPQALRDFTNFVNNYPQHAFLPEAYYYIAFTYEDIMYDISAAKTAYYDFLVRFPSHKLVTDANLSVKYLGMSPEEIVASFEREEETILSEE